MNPFLSFFTMSCEFTENWTLTDHAVVNQNAGYWSKQAAGLFEHIYLPRFVTALLWYTI